jgi:hypothetical protein
VEKNPLSFEIAQIWVNVGMPFKTKDPLFRTTLRQNNQDDIVEKVNFYTAFSDDK